MFSTGNDPNCMLPHDLSQCVRLVPIPELKSLTLLGLGQLILVRLLR